MFKVSLEYTFQNELLTMLFFSIKRLNIVYNRTQPYNRRWNGLFTV